MKANDQETHNRRRMIKREVSSLRQRIGLATIPEDKRMQEQIKGLEKELFELDRKRNHI